MLEEISTRRSAAEEAQGRSRLYRLVGHAFAFPDAALYQEFAGGAWRREVVETLTALPFSLDLADLSLTPAEITSQELQSEYVRLFEVGLMGGPPCSLFAGHHERDRLRMMEELLRFYNFFGLSLAQGTMPDHLSAELEFMYFLTFGEAEAIREGGDRGSYLRAERDFLERHLGRFLAQLLDKVQAQKPLPFLESLVGLGYRLTQGDHGYVVAALAASEPS
jgi:DMSO reductase family type II enzyme chaperone